ncbi:lipase [Francisella tularensis subsp. holarctica PHIT-FT049]|uniref:hypothetical protein n=1 Tax=Francisella tularensis TaxID=263 RepID=UPI0003E769EB|nr:lipase [Francisella tularensis subsp. holarctica PHIT-FT049]ALK93254.1 lipase [Francisella tularensis]
MENNLLISNFKQWLFLILLSSISISSICYSNARSEIIIENNCSVPIFLNVAPGNSTGKKIDNQKLLANEYINLGQYTNDKIFNNTSIININYHSENLQNNGSSIQFSLKNGWKSNKAYFNN